MKHALPSLLCLLSALGAGFFLGRSLPAPETPDPAWIPWLFGALFIIACLWLLARGLRPLTHVPDLLDANPGDLLAGGPKVSELLGLETRESVEAIDGALEQLEQQSVPKGPVEEIRAATRRMESMLNRAVDAVTGEVPGRKK